MSIMALEKSKSQTLTTESPADDADGIELPVKIKRGPGRPSRRQKLADGAQSAAMPKRGRGRPRLQPDLLLSERFQMRISKEELELITAMGGSRWVRQIVTAAVQAGRSQAAEAAARGEPFDPAAIAAQIKLQQDGVADGGEEEKPRFRKPDGVAADQVKAAREEAGVTPISTATKMLRFAEMGVPCGFPFDADDASVEPMDLTEYLVRHPDMSYVVTAVGDSMVDAGIFEGDRLVIDRQVQPMHRDIVMAYLNGTFTIKRYLRDDARGKVYLCPDNALANYPAIEITKDDSFYVEGVVVSVMRRLRR